MKDIRILILQRGWVVVGEYTKDGTEVVVTNGNVIRRWGTTKGLGELALDGPLKDTTLDPIPETRLHELGVVASIKCVTEKWRKHVKCNCKCTCC